MKEDVAHEWEWDTCFLLIQPQSCILHIFSHSPPNKNELCYHTNRPWFWYTTSSLQMTNKNVCFIWLEMYLKVNYHNKCNWNGKFITFIFERISCSLLYILSTFSSYGSSSFVHIMKVDVAIYRICLCAAWKWKKWHKNRTEQSISKSYKNLDHSSSLMRSEKK